MEIVKGIVGPPRFAVACASWPALGSARQGARERPDGLLSQQPVDHERRRGERGLPGSEIEKWRTLRLSEGGWVPELLVKQRAAAARAFSEMR